MSTHEPPLVSIVMPTHNRPEEIRIAIQSVWAQSWERWELIIVNDGGPDIAELVRALDPAGRITYVRLPLPGGAGAARNTALRLARGKYVAYLDDDDWYDPDHLASLVEVLERGSHAVAYTDSRRVIEVKQDGRYVAKAVQQPFYAMDFSREGLLVNNYIPILCLMHLRDCLDEVGLFDETLPVLEDWELWIRLSQAFDFVRVPRVSCSVRWREDGSSTTTGRRWEHLPTAQLIHQRHALPGTARPALLEARGQLIDCLRRSAEGTAPTCSVLLVVSRADRAESLLARLSALADRTRRVSYEVIVVDDGATEQVLALFRSTGDEVRGGRSPRPGLGAAISSGAAEARGRYLVMLATDATVRANWLRALVDDTSAHPEAAAIGAKLLLPEGNGVAAAGMCCPKGGGRAHVLHRGARPWSDALLQRQQVDTLPHGAVLMAKTMFDELGGSNETLEGESAIAELCWRAGRRGAVVVQPHSIVYRAAPEMLLVATAPPSPESTQAPVGRPPPKRDSVLRVPQVERSQPSPLAATLANLSAIAAQRSTHA